MSESGRLLVDAHGRPVFLLADTAWSLVLRPTRDEAASYLRRRVEQRFNAVTFVLFAPGRTELAPGVANGYGDEPFERRGGRPDPTRPLLTPGADPRDPVQYDYWDHVDHVVADLRVLMAEAAVQLQHVLGAAAEPIEATATHVHGPSIVDLAVAARPVLDLIRGQAPDGAVAAAAISIVPSRVSWHVPGAVGVVVVR